MTGRRERQKAAEEKYGKPFAEIVRDFASKNWGKGATALELGYDVTAFGRLLKRKGWSDWFLPGHETIQFKAGVAKRAAMKIDMTPARSANPCYIRVRLDGHYDTVAGHCRRRGMSPATVYDRLSKGMTIKRAIAARVVGK